MPQPAGHASPPRATWPCDVSACPEWSPCQRSIRLLREACGVLHTKGSFKQIPAQGTIQTWNRFKRIENITRSTIFTLVILYLKACVGDVDKLRGTCCPEGSSSKFPKGAGHQCNFDTWQAPKPSSVTGCVEGGGKMVRWGMKRTEKAREYFLEKCWSFTEGTQL